MSISPTGMIRLLYGVSYSVYGLLLPYLPLLLRQQGLSDAELTLALSGIGVSALIPPFLIAHLVDTKLAFERVLPWLLFASTCAIPCWFLANSALAGFIVTVLFFSCFFPTISLLDTYTLIYIRRHSERGVSDTAVRADKIPPAPAPSISFTSIRVWGSVGFVVPSVALLILQTFVPISGSVVFGLATLSCLVSLLIARHLPRNGTTAAPVGVPSLEALRSAIRPPLRRFFASTSVAGLALAIFYIIFPRYLQELGCSTVTVGLIINLGVVAEILFMPRAAKLIQRFSAERVIAFGILAQVLRLTLLSVFPSLPVAIIAQLLHAPMIIGYFVAAPLFLQSHASEHARFSLQSIYIVLMLGMARLCGPMLFSLLLAWRDTDSGSGILMGMFLCAGLSLLGLLIASVNKPCVDK